LLASEGTAAISSSAIRQALLAGQVEKAADWLGRPYRVEGPVIHGDHRGRTIGFPTANIAVWDEQILPSNGVYACWAQVDHEKHPAVINIGTRPTFTPDEFRPHVEAHLLDFEREIYTRELTLEFIARLRPEQKFPNASASSSRSRRISPAHVPCSPRFDGPGEPVRARAAFPK